MGFRVQPIIDAQRRVVALELLAADAEALAFDDARAMAAHDLEALEPAHKLRAETGLRIHANVEWTTLWLASKELAARIAPGLVVELVERYDTISKASRKEQLAVLETVEAIRRRGGKIAMDDVSPSKLASELVGSLCPEIIKVESRDALLGIRRAARNALIIAERIETKEQAELALALGASELQGFWCDEVALWRDADSEVA